MLTYKSLHDRAVVSFTGDVDWTSVCQLVEVVDTLVECHFHTCIEAVTRARPLTTLAPGECYALLPDGRFERRRLEPFEACAELAQGRQASPARS